MAIDLKRMERDILEAATLGSIGFLYSLNSAASTNLTPASRVLMEKYGPIDAYGQLVTIINYLVEKRYLFPYFDNSRKEISGQAAGLTPEGLKRLQELQCRIRAWVCENWFPVAVAGITAFIGIGSIVVDLIVNRN